MVYGSYTKTQCEFDEGMEKPITLFWGIEINDIIR